jgi:hypothetical protein
VFFQQTLPRSKIDSRNLVRRRLPRALRQTVKDIHDRIDRGQDVRLSPPQRRQTQSGQSGLQGAEVVAAQNKIVQEVAGAVSVVKMDRIKEDPGEARVSDHVGSNSRKFPEDALDVRACRGRATLRGQMNLLWQMPTALLVLTAFASHGFAPIGCRLKQSNAQKGPAALGQPEIDID